MSLIIEDYFPFSYKQVKNNGLKASIAGDEKNRAISDPASPFRSKNRGVRNPFV